MPDNFRDRLNERRRNRTTKRVDPIAERRQDLALRREKILLDLQERQVELIEEQGRRCMDYEMKFNRAHGSELDLERAKGPRNLQTLLRQIKVSRSLIETNPFAKSAVSNLINYTLGQHGMRFRVLDSGKVSVSERVSLLWDRWVSQVGFIADQSEIVRRGLRDGSNVIRWFASDDGSLTYRFIEPEQIQSKGEGDPVNPGAEWGLDVDPKDPVERRGYWVDYDLNKHDRQAKPVYVPVDEIDYLPWYDADKNTMRPTPLLYTVQAYLEGAAGVIKNMRELVRVQTAIAIIREHPEGIGGSELASWARTRAHKRPLDPDTDTYINQEKMQSGTIVDVQNGEKIHFPAAQMQVDRMVSAVQADLRAVAAALGLPEFIFSADASSSNYASLLAAEGPAVKTFEYQQGCLSRFLEKAFRRFLKQAVTNGIRVFDGQEWVREKLPKKVLRMPISVTGPSVRTNKQFETARVNSIEAKAGVVSPQQWCEGRNRDYHETMAQIEAHNKQYPDLQWPPKDPGVDQNEDQTGSENRNAGGAE